jgi:UDP-N-acetylmuramoylalanine--D-glutamate ligase
MEDNPIAMESARRDLSDLDKKVEFVSPDPSHLGRIDLVIPSPGVPPRHPILAAAHEDNIEILSEIEVAYRFLKRPMIAITGTNGKTTTTTLIGEILSGCDRKAFVGGNIGQPLIGYVGGDQPDDVIVLEVSSFQLQWIDQFHPCIAILLNTTPDHVDYHGTFDAYREVKERIFLKQTANDLAILNDDEPWTASLASRLAAHAICFSALHPVAGGIFVSSNNIVFETESGETEHYPLSMINVPGRHNQENVMAAIVAARAFGCGSDAVFSAVSHFHGISHRIEFVEEKNGVRFYDDSKGTNVGAVVRALETFEQPVVLLMGGRDKEGDFETLAPFIRKHVRFLVLFGEARDCIWERIGDVVATHMTPTLDEAVTLAASLAVAGNVVLLSPGCASFDEFKNYKDRGRFFQEKVKALS